MKYRSANNRNGSVTFDACLNFSDVDSIISRKFNFAITGKAFLRMETKSSVMPNFSNQFALADYFRSCDSTWPVESCRVRKTQSDAIGTLSPV